jgi:hypothetical protein
MKLSARNQMTVVIKAVKKGQATAAPLDRRVTMTASGEEAAHGRG